MEILLLEPTVKSTIWGGRKLIEDYGFVSEGDNAAEAWLLSCHKDGPSYVINGENKGKTLKEVLDNEGASVLGTHNADISGFPVLIKIIDACDKLSVQVHPGDEYAWKFENENGKTEAWYVLEAAPGAKLIYGVNREMTREQFASFIEDGTLLETVNSVEVKPGDVVFIPSGMLHAIGEGILLAEVQQSSNTTYRVFDYNRVDKAGKPRELHVRKAAEVVDLTVPAVDFSPKGEPQKTEDAVKTYLTGCRYFGMTKVSLNGSYTDSADETSFVSLLVLSGSGTITDGKNTLAIGKGSSVFIPAGFGAFTVSGDGLEMLETRT